LTIVFAVKELGEKVGVVVVLAVAALIYNVSPDIKDVTAGVNVAVIMSDDPPADAYKLCDWMSTAKLKLASRPESNNGPVWLAYTLG